MSIPVPLVGAQLGMRKVRVTAKTDLEMDMKVRVRRGDSTSHKMVSLAEEYKRFLSDNFKEAQRKLVKFPPSFRYGKEHAKLTHGFPQLLKNEDSSVEDKNWKTNLLGSQGEEVVYNSLDQVLQKRQGPCAFWHSMNLSHLLKVAKETVKHEL